jgi:phage recombination protein Bet
MTHPQDTARDAERARVAMLERATPQVDPAIATGPVAMTRVESHPVQTREVAEWTESQVDLIRRMYAKDTTNDEFSVFLYVCKRTGLDPMARQIYAIKRKDEGSEKRMTIQTAIDGFRLIAERTGKYRGQTPPEWCGSDGIWRDVWTSNEPPVAARIGVYVADFAHPLYGVAHYREYVVNNATGKPNRMWGKMFANQLAKCAEALALRKGFPQDLSGIYTNDEMGQADSVDEGRPRETGSKSVPLTFPFGEHRGKDLGDPAITTSLLVRAVEWIQSDERRSDRMLDLERAACAEIIRRVDTLDDIDLGRLRDRLQKAQQSEVAFEWTDVLAAIEDVNDRRAMDAAPEDEPDLDPTTAGDRADFNESTKPVDGGIDDATEDRLDRDRGLGGSEVVQQ